MVIFKRVSSWLSSLDGLKYVQQVLLLGVLPFLILISHLQIYQYVETHLYTLEFVDIGFGDFFQLARYYNSGVAFSMASRRPLIGNQEWITFLMPLIASLSLIGILIIYFKRMNRLTRQGLVLLISGGLINLIVHKKESVVLDYWVLKFTEDFFLPFNLIDLMIFTGLIPVLFWLKRECGKL